MITVRIDTSPLKNANAIRGVGVYTRFLKQELERSSDIKMCGSSDPKCKPDIVHYPYFDLFFSTLPFAKKGKKVVTVHDVIPLLFPHYYDPGVKGKLRFLKQQAALQRVDAVITDSHASKSDIVKYLKVDPNKVHVVYLAGNPSIHKVSEEEVKKIREKYHLPVKYVLYVGDINYNKNIPQLIKSLKFMPEDIHLVCVGKNFYEQHIPEWKWIETQIALSDVGSRVQFITEILGSATDELSAIYSGAAVYIQPSLAEGFGLPVLEAMQCFTPVVCSHNSSLTEVGGECVVYVDPVAESIAGGVQKILDLRKPERLQFVEHAYQRSQFFNWKKTADQTIAVYKKML